MKIITFITIYLVTSIVSANPLLGEWKSDEERTLREVESVKDMPQKTKQFFKDNFFGRLELRITENIIYSKFEGEESEGPYEILKQTENSVTLKAWNENLNEYEEQTFYIEGEAIYTIISKYSFKEYFRKIK